MKRHRVAMVALSVMLPATWQVSARAAEEGWAEVRSSRAAVAATDGVSGPGRDGDRLWMTRPGDTLESIAERTTGTASLATEIARYNALDRQTALLPDRLLYVPAALLLPAKGGVAAVNWQIQEFDTPAATDTSAVAVDAGPAVRAIAAVHSENLDLFAGEVSVLGEVSVSRVAVGNGSVLRAEVLKSGELMVIAQSAGSSSLRLWHTDGRQSDYNIRVSESDPQTRVRMERMVRMRVRMVEFRKNALGKLGIDWADSTSGPGFAFAGDAVGNNLFRPTVEGFEGLPNRVDPFSTYFGIASNITSRINFLASNGDATTLAEPVLTASNGGKASFLAGGEVPYPSVGANGVPIVQFKEYGIKLDVSPSIDDAGNVRTSVSTEISQLDQAVSVQGAPGLLTRRAETQVNVRSGETIVISGLLSSESSSDLDKLPGIGNLPVIGAFFRSQSRRDTVTELVIFVTPEIVDPAMAALDLEERQRFEAAGRRLDTARSTLPLLD